MGHRTPSSEASAFAMRLTAARMAQGLSQTQLAALIGVALPRYNGWEHALSMPNRIALYQGLCRHLDVTVDWLFFGDSAPLAIETEKRLEAALLAVAARRTVTS